jgi:Skp family chaperone for outer membrane proteins
MKRILCLMGIALAALWTVSSMAAGVAVIDMQQIFQNSKQVKQINDGLENNLLHKKRAWIA